MRTRIFPLLCPGECLTIFTDTALRADTGSNSLNMHLDWNCRYMNIVRHARRRQTIVTDVSPTERIRRTRPHKKMLDHFLLVTFFFFFLSLPEFSFANHFTTCDPEALEGLATRALFPIRSIGATASSSAAKSVDVKVVEQSQLITGVEDSYGGVTVEITEPMDSQVFATRLRASIENWKQQGKKGLWIKLPLEHSNLVDAVVKEGFRYHHAEPSYVMLVRWLPESKDTIPANASHRVAVGAFVMNGKKEVLVVQEKSGKFKDTGVWKFPTGVVNEGEEIWTAAIREVKEETGIDTEFVEILAFRQSHEFFFTKSDLFFLCILRPSSSSIEKQDLEIEEAQWMPIEEYAAQPFVLQNKQFHAMAKLCLAKAGTGCAGFDKLATTTGSGKLTYLYCNCMENLQQSL